MVENKSSKTPAETSHDESGLTAGTIVLGEFHLKALNEGGAEIRMSDERNQSNILLRKKSLGKELEAGATYQITATRVAPAPAFATVTAIVPTTDVGSLPGTAVIDKDATAERAAEVKAERAQAIDEAG